MLPALVLSLGHGGRVRSFVMYLLGDTSTRICYQLGERGYASNYVARYLFRVAWPVLIPVVMRASKNQQLPSHIITYDSNNLLRRY